MKLNFLKIGPSAPLKDFKGASLQMKRGFTPTPMNIGVSPAKAGRGFTLVELMIVFSISSLIGLMVITGYPEFESNIEFKNQVLDVAITIREAQVYGVSVKKAGAGTFNVPYGVYFDMSAPGSYIFFADMDSNKFYDAIVDLTIGQPIILKNGYTVSDLCVKFPLRALDCYSDGAWLGVETLSIFFKRPEPDAIIKYGISSGYSFATIEIQNTAGNKKTIRVTNTGQISV